MATEKIKTNGRLLSQVLLSYKTTFDALCELINNSIQAQATEVKIEIDLVDDDDVVPFPFTEYRIIDNGVGVTAADFNQKILEIATDAKPGGKGIGRFAAFQIGKSVVIDTIAYDKILEKYTRTQLSLNIANFDKKDLNDCDVEVASETLNTDNVNSNYKVVIKDFWDDIEITTYPKKKLSSQLIPGKLEEALFLRYSSSLLTSKMVFYVNNVKIETNNFLVEDPETKTFPVTLPDDTTTNVSLEFVHYKGKNKNTIIAYRIENDGIKVTGYEDILTFDFPDDNSWLVHVDCDVFNANTDSFRNLPFDGMDNDLAEIKKGVKHEIFTFLQEKHRKYFAFKQTLVNDQYYPYKNKMPSRSKEIVFNQLAYFLEEDYFILHSENQLRKVVYPLLDRAISNGDVEEILKSIITLDDEKIKLFKKLLENVELSDIIRFSNDVAKKEQFLVFLNELIYGDISKHLLERKQLHKIIEKNLWLFGEEYTNTPVLFSDTSLRNNLDELRKDELAYKKNNEHGNFNDISDKEILDITDLWFYNDKILANGKREIMIVELKSPKVKISQQELNQVDKYMFDIEKLDKFSKNINYRIFLVSSGLTAFGESKVGTDTAFPTLYTKSKTHNIEIHVASWADIIARNRQHLTYLGDYLKTKDIDAKTIFEKDYPELDITNLKISSSKSKKVP